MGIYRQPHHKSHIADPDLLSSNYQGKFILRCNNNIRRICLLSKSASIMHTLGTGHKVLKKISPNEKINSGYAGLSGYRAVGCGVSQEHIGYIIITCHNE